MYTVREFAENRINSGIFARFVLFLSGMPDKNNTNRVILVRHRTFTSRFAGVF